MWLGLVVVASLVVTGAVAYAARLRVADPSPVTTNPYTGQSGSPDCTWYAWQRMHDTLGIDMQDTADAGGWADLARRPQEFWWEPGNKYVPAQVLPGLTANPAPGDVVVFPDAVADWAYPSHVAFVEQVESGRYFISEQSFQDYAPGSNTLPYPYVTHRWISLVAMRQAEPRASFIRFGAPIGDDAAYVAESPYPTVAPGQPFTISFIERNTGFHTWTDTDGYALACTADCMGATSVGLERAAVAPGQQFTFDIALTASATPGVYQSAWQLGHNGVPFGNRGLFMAITVTSPSVASPSATPAPATPTPTTQPTTTPGPTTPAPSADNSQWMPPPVSVTAQPGQVVYAGVTYTNTGSTTWSDADGYSLACDPAASKGTACPQTLAPGTIGTPVAPGQSYTFVVVFIAPSAPGTYRTRWNMQHNGAVFGDTTGEIDILVT